MKFAGIYTPAITPLDKDGAIDRKAFAAVLEHLIASGVHGIIIAGSTGESPGPAARIASAAARASAPPRRKAIMSMDCSSLSPSPRNGTQAPESCSAISPSGVLRSFKTVSLRLAPIGSVAARPARSESR